MFLSRGRNTGFIDLKGALMRHQVTCKDELKPGAGLFTYIIYFHARNKERDRFVCKKTATQKHTLRDADVIQTTFVERYSNLIHKHKMCDNSVDT